MLSRICILLLTGLSLVFSQDVYKDKESVPSQLRLDNITGGLPGTISPNLIASVDEKEYVVDAGDVFLIKIDVPGPAIKVFQAMVTADGNVMLPEAPSVDVKRIPLVEAKKKIHQILTKYNPDSEIEVFLYQVHPIKVTVLGAVEENHKQQLLSSSRLFDAVQNALYAVGLKTDAMSNPEDEDRKKLPDEKLEDVTLRRIQILRGGEKHEYDLLRFKRLGDLKHNPYLLDNDVIVVPFKGEKTHTITVKGAVGQEFQFEYSPTDRLKDAIYFAGGMLPTADSSRIELYRFSSDRISVNKLILDFDQDMNFPLKADDRIFVRYKAQYHEKYQVEIEGEVNYPGVYAIEDGKTTLTELVNKSGGLTDKAALRNAKIIRQKILLEDKELNRLRRMTVEEMNDLEKSYFRLRTREEIRIVACDFEKLFVQNQMSEDVVLRDEDIIIIPERSKIVFISGGVISPGNVVYDQNWKFRDYINAAGGFNKRARKGDVKIIKGKTGIWLDADEEVRIEEGDIVFVPEKEERDWWEIFKEGLVISSQIATILFIISNVSK